MIIAQILLVLLEYKNTDRFISSMITRIILHKEWVDPVLEEEVALEKIKAKANKEDNFSAE